MWGVPEPIVTPAVKGDLANTDVNAFHDRFSVGDGQRERG
jgi:hypothetical protein